MQLAVPLIRLFDYPVDEILAAMPDAASPVWDVDGARQTKHEVHRQTRSITFAWMSNSWQPGQSVAVQTYDYAPVALARAAYACADALARHYGGKAVRLTLAELAPRGQIATHRDHGAGLQLVHRCHVPLVTNEHVHFFIDLIDHRMEQGVAYEFDNSRRHSVVNDSDVPRVHLLCDIMPAAQYVP